MRVLVMKKSSFFSLLSTIIIVVMLTVISLVVFFSPAQVINASNSMGAIYSGNTDKNNVALMFNVYSGNEYIEPIMKILSDNGVKATFFVGGCWVAKNNELIKKISDNGFEIGNHGYNHLEHSKLGVAIQQKEIQDTHDLVKDICGIDMNLFAPPSGDYNKKVVDVADGLGYKTIMWSKDTIDWRDHNSTLIYSRAVKDPANGDMILMHPTAATLEALDDIIKFYIDAGYNLTTVSETIGN